MRDTCTDLNGNPSHRHFAWTDSSDTASHHTAKTQMAISEEHRHGVRDGKPWAVTVVWTGCAGLCCGGKANSFTAASGHIGQLRRHTKRQACVLASSTQANRPSCYHSQADTLQADVQQTQTRLHTRARAHAPASLRHVSKQTKWQAGSLWGLAHLMKQQLFSLQLGL